jgi:hypothetical protein
MRWMRWRSSGSSLGRPTEGAREPPPPVELEPSAVPGEDGGGLNDEEVVAPTRPQAGQPDPEDPIPMGEPGSGDGSLKDQQLMAELKVLQGDRRRLDEQGAKEGPETNHEDHRGPPRHQAWHLSRHSTGAGVAVVREAQAGQAEDFLTGTRGEMLRVAQSTGHAAQSTVQGW